LLERGVCGVNAGRGSVIAGNHDFNLDSTPREGWEHARTAHLGLSAARALFLGEEAQAARITYLEYAAAEIQAKEGGRTWKVYGSPGTPDFGGMAFMYDREKDGPMLAGAIPEDTDILVTHGPPHGILDEALGKTRAGCEDLMARVGEVKPRLHAFGHIHQAYGTEVRAWKDAGGKKTVFVNAANTPGGGRMLALRARGVAPTVGGPNFRPVIVDLLDFPAGEE